MSVINDAVRWAVETAEDNSHGYSQSVRWGPSYDCSSFVITAFRQAGVDLKSTYTGNMYADFLSHGFSDVTRECNLVTGVGLERGDVLLNTLSHTALYIGNHQIVHARSSNGTSDTADNDGSEIRLQQYFNYSPWNFVLRFMGDSAADAEPKSEPLPKEKNVILIKKGMSGEAVKAMQCLLNYHGARIDADGQYGNLTWAALSSFQRRHGLENDAVCGPLTWAELIKE